MTCNKNGAYCKWYISHGAGPTYLPKSSKELAEKLAYRNYCVKKLGTVTQEIEVLKQCLMNVQDAENSQAALGDDSEQGKLLGGYLHNYDEESQQWLEEECEYSKNYPEHLIHNTLDGHIVRSKSEGIISDALYRNKIPYKYECGIYLDGAQYFPDFTLFHEGKRQKIYWEHFGMMDIPLYCEKAYSKLRTYGVHGIIPTINLITTYETRSHPVDSMKIQSVIDEYFK